MNINYLDSMTEVANVFKVELQDGEKVVFTAKLSTFGTQTDQLLGADSYFTLTNRRVIADNKVGFWIFNIADDVNNFSKVTGGVFIFKYTYFSIELNKEILYGYGKQKLTGFHFYFYKKDIEKFEEIMNSLTR